MYKAMVAPVLGATEKGSLGKQENDDIKEQMILNGKKERKKPCN